MAPGGSNPFAQREAGVDADGRVDPFLEAAERLIRERGADSWTLADLAEDLGVEEGEVRQRFPAEFDAFREVICGDETHFEIQIRKTDDMPASEAMVAVFEACVPDFDWTFWIELWSLSLRDPRAHELRRELDMRWREQMLGIIERGCRQGEFTVPDPELAAVTIGTLIDSMAVNATLDDTTVRPNYMLDACVAVATSLLGANLRLRRQGEERSG